MPGLEKPATAAAVDDDLLHGLCLEVLEGRTMRLGMTGDHGLPDDVEKLVRAALTAAVEQYRPDKLVGVSCIADGPDAWFAEAALDHGGRIEVVLPAGEYRESLPESHHATHDDLIRRTSEAYSTGLTASISETH